MSAVAGPGIGESPVAPSRGVRLFALAGLYLLGLLRLAGIKPEETVGTVRLLV